METFDVYPLFDIEPVRGDGIYLFDKSNNAFMDFYGGHAVISVGHSHPHYVKRITTQLNKLGFYSNSVKIPLQNELASLLGSISGYNNYNLFLCNSGAEANENALKLASFKNGRKKIIAFQKSFHGRTSLAVAATDDKKIQAPVNHNPNIIFLPWNDEAALAEHFSDEISAVIIEGIQGVGGVHVPAPHFLKTLRNYCNQFGAYLILDEIQSGYGRSGKFFAHQYAGIKPDLITVAKGMGNGFPVAGVLINPQFEAKHGLLGTTFGGNYLACAAAIAVLEIIKEEQLIENAKTIGHYLIAELKKMDHVGEVRGQGLMLGIDLEEPCAKARQTLLFEHKIFTGNSSDKNTLRLLPPLCITRQQADIFLQALQTTLKKQAGYEAVSVGR
jgi:acetylornithine aminotransferase